MTVREGVALGLVGAILLTAGFLIGKSLGDNPKLPEFGSVPATLTTNPDVQIPKYAPQKGLPAIAVTTGEVVTTESSESGAPAESGTATSTVEETKEEKTPVTTTPPKPEITVGEEEK